MKKTAVIISVVLVVMIALTACVSQEDAEKIEERIEEKIEEKLEEQGFEPAEAEEPEIEVTEEEVVAEEVSEPESGEVPAPEEEIPAEEPAADPYAWLGLTDMPRCNYLDCVASNHYICVKDNYIDMLDTATEETDVVDGINTYTEEKGTSRTYSVEGVVTTVNDAAKNYMVSDASSLIETAKAEQEKNIKEGIDIKGRRFIEKGTDSIPLYGDYTGDNASYEYYEYDYPSMEEYGRSMTERFYMKDGDVFAIYQEVEVGDNDSEFVSIIKSISTEIPDGIFELPDLTGYEELTF